METHLGEGILEVGLGGDVWDFDHGTSTETSSQVGWASQDPSQMVVVHEVVTFGLEDLLDTFSGGGETLEDFDNGITLINNYDVIKY